MLKNISVHFKCGEIHELIGRNGMGKSNKNCGFPKRVVIIIRDVFHTIRGTKT